MEEMLKGVNTSPVTVNPWCFWKQPPVESHVELKSPSLCPQTSKMPEIGGSCTPLGYETLEFKNLLLFTLFGKQHSNKLAKGPGLSVTEGQRLRCKEHQGLAIDQPALRLDNEEGCQEEIAEAELRSQSSKALCGSSQSFKVRGTGQAAVSFGRRSHLEARGWTTGA